MKKPRLLVALGLILAAAAAIVGLTAPGNSTPTLDLSVTVQDHFTLTLSGPVAIQLAGFPTSQEEVESTAYTITAKSNWKKGYTIKVTSASDIVFDYDPSNLSNTLETLINPEDDDYITLGDLKVKRGDLSSFLDSLGPEGFLIIEADDKTSKTGQSYDDIKFSVTPDGEEYAGSYTTTVTFTMAPKT